MFMWDAPFRATLADGQPCLLLGLLNSDSLNAVYMDQEGRISTIPVSELTVDWRYDVRKDVWIDQNVPKDMEDMIED